MKILLAAYDKFNPSLGTFHTIIISEIHEHYIKRMWNEACEHFKFLITSNTDMTAMSSMQCRILTFFAAATDNKKKAK